MTATHNTIEQPSPWHPPSQLPERYETARTLLRWWQASDAKGMLEALDADRSSYLPWLPWVESDNQTVAQCIYQIERMRREAQAGDDFTLGIFDRATGAVIGGTGLHRLVRSSLQAEIGYWVRPERRGEGLCTEAVAGLISWAFTPQADGGWGLHRIEIFCAGGNRASQRVPEKLGLRPEVKKLKARWVSGLGWNDTLGWGVLAEQWSCAAQRWAGGPHDTTLLDPNPL